MKRFVILTLMTLLLIGVAYAACTFVKPISSATLKGREMFNTSCANINGTKNCTISCSSALTASSFTLVTYNNTENSNDNYTNASYATTQVIDANDWTCSGTCENPESNQDTLTAVTGMIIDNSVPTCVYASALVSGGTYKPKQKWSVTGKNATSGTIKIGNSEVRAMTETSSNSDLFEWTGDERTVPEGIYGVKTSMTDGTNTTTCSLSSVQIDEQSTLKLVGAAIAIDDASKKGQETTTTSNNQAAIGFLIIAGGAVLFLNMQGKKKK